MDIRYITTCSIQCECCLLSISALLQAAAASGSSSSSDKADDAKAAHKSEHRGRSHRSQARPQPAPSDHGVPVKGFVEQLPDMTLIQCCTSTNFWLLFLTCSIGESASQALSTAQPAR